MKRVRGTIDWRFCKATAKLLADAHRITANTLDHNGRSVLPNLSAELGRCAEVWKKIIEDAAVASPRDVGGQS